MVGIAFNVQGAPVAVEAGMDDRTTSHRTVRADGFGFPGAYQFKLLRVGLDRTEVKTQSADGHSDTGRPGQLKKSPACQFHGYFLSLFQNSAIQLIFFN